MRRFGKQFFHLPKREGHDMLICGWTAGIAACIRFFIAKWKGKVRSVAIEKVLRLKKRNVTFLPLKYWTRHSTEVVSFCFLGSSLKFLRIKGYSRPTLLSTFIKNMQNLKNSPHLWAVLYCLELSWLPGLQTSIYAEAVACFSLASFICTKVTGANHFFMFNPDL